MCTFFNPGLKDNVFFCKNVESVHKGKMQTLNRMI